MSNSEHPLTLTAEQRRSNQIKLLVLWLVPFGLMAIAGITYLLVQSGKISLGSKNHGDLINPPVQLRELFQASGDLSLVEILDDKWTLVVRTRERCEAACKEALYLSRQLHIRLDKSADRVQRVLLIDNYRDDPAFMSFVDQEHKLLKVFVTDGASLRSLDESIARAVLSSDRQLENGESPVVNFFVVDPQGWAMMAYHQGHDGNGILKDLKHLLRYSRER